MTEKIYVCNVCENCRCYKVSDFEHLLPVRCVHAHPIEESVDTNWHETDVIE